MGKVLKVQRITGLNAHPNHARSARGTWGFTLLEFLIAMTILGILGAIGFTSVRAPSARLLANDYQALVQQARFEAIKRNRPVAVVWERTRFVSRVKNDNEVNCDAENSTQLRVKRIDEYPNVEVAPSGTGNGIVWLPSGMARTCTNNLDVSGRVSFSKTGGGAGITVSISPSARIQVK